MNAWLIKGDDPALVGEAARNQVHELSGGDGLCVEELAGDDTVTVGAIVETCQTPPFLGNRRVVLARDMARFDSDELAPLLAFLAAPLPTTFLVMTAGAGRLSVKLTNAVKKVGTVVDTAPGQSRGDRATWLDRKLAEAPVRLDREAARLLGAHLGEEVGRLSSLLDTLAGAFGPGARIGAAALEPYLGGAGGVPPWDLTDAVDRGRVADAIGLLHRMLDGGGRHPLEIMATLHRHYGGMLRVDGAEVAGEKAAVELLGLAPYPAKKILEQSRRLGSAKVGRAVELLAAADVDLRGASSWPPELVMEVLVTRLSGLARR
ncbi:MAG: DNA polymerase III subunit delta [Acidimicrobiales bacterium]